MIEAFLYSLIYAANVFIIAASVHKSSYYMRNTSLKLYFCTNKNYCQHLLKSSQKIHLKFISNHKIIKNISGNFPIP